MQQGVGLQERQRRRLNAKCFMEGTPSNTSNPLVSPRLKPHPCMAPALNSVFAAAVHALQAAGAQQR